jgi:lipid-A-disaccharide synthase
VDFIGHPLVDVVRRTNSRAEFCGRYGLNSRQPIVTLLPGSRPGELAHNLPRMLEACRILQPSHPHQIVLVAALGLTQAQLAQHAPAGSQVQIVQGATYDALAAADSAIISSGTATVEAALLGVPMVVVYCVSGITAFIARRLVRTPFFSMVNLIAGRQVVPELIQERFTPEAVADQLRHLLDSTEAREQMKHDLAEVRARLAPSSAAGSGGAIERAAEIIVRML